MNLDSKRARVRIGARMVELRGVHGRTQKECAEALGVGQSSYSDMEAGKLRIRRRDLVTLAVLYGLSLEDAFPEFEVRAAA